MKKQSGVLHGLITLMLTLCALAVLTAVCFAADIVASGYCGGEGNKKNLSWTLDSEGTLTISGNGKMAYYNEYSGGPWARDKVKNVSIENGATSIGAYAFNGCGNLTDITIPSSVTSIGDVAFSGCSSLTSITIPSSVTSIGTNPFRNCSSLTSIFVSETNTEYDSRNNCNAIIATATNTLICGCSNTSIPNSVTSIGDYAFYYCSRLTSITLPNSVTSIGYYAFSGCSSLTSITIPSSVTRIDWDAFSGCSSLTSFTIPNSVIYIGNEAFYGCSSLTSITLPNGVTIIGGKTFYGCSSLTSITIPSSVTSIDIGAFYGCSSLTSITIPSSVTSIGDYAFEDCYSLTSITIPSNVTSIGNGAFSNCRNLTSITIPNGVTRIGRNAFYCCRSLTSITLPSSATSIGDCAFFSCSSLTSITLPNGVTRIGGKAFYGCSSLTSITLPNSVTSIYGDSFNKCSNLESAYFHGNAPTVFNEGTIFDECKKTFCIYYVPGTSGWNAEKGTWRGYPLKTWNGKIIPEEITVSVPTGKYCIQVIDEFGAPISDADVAWNDDSGTTNQEGAVFFERFTAGNPVIRVSKAGYTVWTNENSNWKKSEKCFEQVILYPESYGGLKLKAAKIGECDLLTQTKVLNLRNDGALIGDLNSGHFDLSCAATDTSDVTGYAIYQNKKEIAKSADGNFQKLDVRDFVEGGGCFVRVTSANGQTMDTRINLQFAKNSVNEDLEFELKGNKISIKVNDEIPYLGGFDGSSYTFEMPIEVPIFVSATQDKIKLGINLKVTSDKTEEEQIDKYIRMIKVAAAAGGTNWTKANATALKNCAAQHNSAEFFKKVDFTVCGYAEANVGSHTAAGHIIVIADVKVAKFEYNTVVWIFPVTVQVGVDFDLEAGGNVSYCLDTQTWNGNVFVNPSIGLSPFIGIGYSDKVGVGAYGAADLDVKWNVFGTNSGLQTVDLTGELGIKVYLGSHEGKKPFAHQTWHLYTANTVSSQSLSPGAAAWDAEPTAADFAPSDLSYLAAESDWAPASAQTYAAGRAAQLKASYQTLLQNTYRNAQPVMLSDGSSLYAAFVRADADSGARYVALTKFDGTSWSEPVRVDAGAILDDAPQLCTDGQTLWLVYARTTQEPGNSLVSYAQHQNIVVGTVNKDTLAFTEQKTYQSDNYMRLPTLSCVNGTPVLAWAESAVTDQESVVNPAASTVYTAEFRSGAWPDARKAADTAGVDSFCIGAQNGTAAIAYISDGTLYCGGRVLAENVIGRAVYGRLPSADADSFIWNAGGALHDEAGTIVTAEGMGREFVIVGDSIYFNQSNGASANLAALHYDAVNDHWSAPILLIGDEQYLENLNAASLNGRTYALGMHTTVTISEDEVDDAKDLVWTQILPVSDLKLSDVSFDSDALVPGGTLPITLTVTNSGDHTVSSLALTANGVSTTQDCQLLPGESAEFTVNITCPSEKQTVTFEVQEPRQDDYTPEDNTADCTVGSADAEIELSLIQIGSRKLVQAVVVNRGLETASGSVLFTGPDGQVLAERTFQNLTYGGTVIAEYEPDSFAALYGEDVTATVRLQQDEPNTLNNTDSVPVLLTVTEILSAQRDAAVVTAEIACMQDSGARVICAFYDADGRLLHTVIQPLQSGKNSLSFTISDANAACAKLFVLDAKNAPAAAGKTVQLNS